jgi:O-antigen/teichoic acid export membrane protein
MSVEGVGTGAERPAQRSVSAAAQALLREIADAGSYRSLAARAKYPVGAMLISQTVLGFGATAVLARALGPRAFGEYALVLTIAGIFQLVAAFPVESGIPKFLAEVRGQDAGPGPLRGLVRAHYAAGLWCRLGAGLLGLAWCALGAGWLSRLYRAQALQGPVVVAALSLCLLTPLTLYFMSCIQGMEQPRRWATGNLLAAVIVFPPLLLGALNFAKWGQFGLMAWIAAGWLGAALACGWLARGALGFLWPGRAGGQQLRQLLPFLLPIWIVPLAGFGSKTLMKAALAWHWGPVPLGHFEIALTLLGHLAVIYQACMIVLLPEWARLYASKQATDLLHSLGQARGVLIGAATAYGAVLVLAGQWVVPAIFGPDQAGAVPAVRVIGLVMPVMIGGWVASATNVISNRTGNIGKANLIWFAIGVPLGLALIPRLSALGAGLAWLGAYLVFTWYYVTRARPFFREVEGWKPLQQP